MRAFAGSSRTTIAVVAAALSVSAVLITPAQMAVAANLKASAIDDASSPSNKAKKIQRTEVCFAVHNTVRGLGDPTTYQVSGTLHAQKNSKGGGTAILLLHGATAERSVWEGAPGVPSMAAQLAEAGYDVFAIDRLGYSRSPYPHSGWTLTVDGQVATIHDIVTQIKDGTYRVTEDTCNGGVESGRPSEKVVLSGHSSGAGLVEYYATQHHDIDGIVPLMWSNQGTSSPFFQEWTLITGPQMAQGKDYVYYWAIGPDGYSHGCEDWLFFTDGADPNTVEQTCGPGYLGGDDPAKTAVGEAVTVAAMQSQIILDIEKVGPTPALLVFADMDAIFTGPEFGGDEDVVTPEIEMWRTRCNCDVEVLSQENAGHFGMVHDSAPETTASIIDWLDSRGL